MHHQAQLQNPACESRTKSEIESPPSWFASISTTGISPAEQKMSGIAWQPNTQSTRLRQNGHNCTPRHGAGLNPKDLGRLDESFANTPLVDPVGGIPDFSSTRVRIEKV